MTAADAGAFRIPPSDPTRDLRERLAAPRQAIEREFVRVGENLISSTQLLDQVSKAYGEMPAALTGPEFERATQGLERISEQIRRLDEGVDATRAFLADMRDFASGVSVRIDELNKGVRTLRTFSVVARVVAATIPDRKHNLAGFAHDITEQGLLLSDEVSSFSNSFKRMRKTLEATSRLSEEFGAHHTEILGSMAAEISRNLSIMEDHRRRAIGQVSQHAARTERISSRVSEVVAILQIGDSTRQRIEHVETALTLLGREGRPDISAQVYPLLVAQMTGAIEDFDGEVETLAGSIETLRADTKAMLEAAGAEAKSLLSAGDAAFEAMTASLQTVAHMFEEYDKSNIALSEAIRQLVAAIGDMLVYLNAFQDIGRNVRLLGINASIKANAVGENGRAFQKVAESLRALNNDTAVPVQEISQRLEKSAAVLNDFTEAAALRDSVDRNAIRETIATSTQGLDATSTSLRTSALLMSEVGPKALARVADTQRAISEQQDFCGDWRRVSHELASLAMPDGDGEDVPPEILSEIYALYTMKAERQIHHMQFGNAPELSDEQTAASDDDLGVDAIFF